MKLRIEIRTPEGEASKTEKRLRPWLIGRNGMVHNVVTSVNDDKLIWTIYCDMNQAMKITRNVAYYDKTLAAVMRNKAVLKLAGMTEEQRLEIERMLKDETKITIVEKDFDAITPR